MNPDQLYQLRNRILQSENKVVSANVVLSVIDSYISVLTFMDKETYQTNEERVRNDSSAPSIHNYFPKVVGE